MCSEWCMVYILVTGKVPLYVFNFILRRIARNVKEGVNLHTRIVISRKKKAHYIKKTKIFVRKNTRFTKCKMQCMWGEYDSFTSDECTVVTGLVDVSADAVRGLKARSSRKTRTVK